jgi:hypothetical protein
MSVSSLTSATDLHKLIIGRQIKGAILKCLVRNKERLDNTVVASEEM